MHGPGKPGPYGGGWRAVEGAGPYGGDGGFRV